MTHEWPEEVGTQTEWHTLETLSLACCDAKDDDYLVTINHPMAHLGSLAGRGKAGKTNQRVRQLP